MPQDKVSQLSRLDTRTAIERLDLQEPAEVAKLLAALPPARANSILSALTEDARARIMAAAPPGTDWSDAQRYPEGTVGRLLEDPPAVFRSLQAETRKLFKKHTPPISYIDAGDARPT